MRTLLALETADSTCGVALWHNGACRAEAHIHRPRVHAAHLTPLIKETMAHAELSIAQVDAVAVSAGPGSYTGLRIGMSTAKGLAMARSLPLIPVPTLEAAAYALAPWVAPSDLVIPALDARRSDVFAAAYASTRGEWDLRINAGPYGTEELAEAVSATAERNSTLWCTGPGAKKAAAALHAHEQASADPRTVRTVPLPTRALSARHVAQRGLMLAGDASEAPHTVEPAYLKAFHGTPSAKSM